MKDEPKTIDLRPTEYAANMPNKREPIFNEGGLLWLVSTILIPCLIGGALKYFHLR
jgi:hypothetical protein